MIASVHDDLSPLDRHAVNDRFAVHRRGIPWNRRHKTGGVTVQQGMSDEGHPTKQDRWRLPSGSCVRSCQSPGGICVCLRPRQLEPLDGRNCTEPVFATARPGIFVSCLLGSRPASGFQRSRQRVECQRLDHPLACSCPCPATRPVTGSHRPPRA